MITFNTYYSDYQGLNAFIADHHDVLFSEDTRSILVQIFCGICEKEFLTSLMQQISKLVPKAQIIGTTTSGEIMNGMVNGLKTVLSFSVFEHSNIKIVFAEEKELSVRESSQPIAEQLDSENAKLLILFSTGLTVDPNRLLENIQQANPCLPVAGGVSGYNHHNQPGFVFCKDGITDSGAVGAVLESEYLSVHQYWHLCWIPIGKEMVITKASGLRVYSIDGMPAYQVFKKYLGVDSKSDMIINSIFPLIVQRHGIQIASMPKYVYDDGSIDFSGKMIEGEKVRFSFGNVEIILKTIDQLTEKICRRRAESIFVYSCVLRRGFLQEASEIETLPLQEIAPTAGFFTNGEFFHSDRSNLLLQSTMTTVVLSETNKPEGESIQKQRNTESEGCGIEIAGARDNVKSSNIVILRALTNLVNTVTKELIERTDELEKLNKETLYSSTHDPLTGLYNRGFFEQEMERLRCCDAPLGIVVCDVDGLKLINDTLGHHEGDTILKATANILKSAFPKEVLVARIGGDEYSALIQENLLADVERFLQKIHEAVTGYNSTNPPVPLSLSFGYAFRKHSSGYTDSLFKEADDNMYREKLHRSKSIRGDLVQTLIQTLEARDMNTDNHSSRLQNLLVKFADSIEIPSQSIFDLQLFARFHDIGKVGIPDQILLKPGPLTSQERTEMQRHSEIGYRIACSSSDLFPISDWILKHHEWWNGRGYPFGLRGEEIPFECRILSIIDSYDAMTSDRPYRSAMGHDAAIRELKRCAGTQFDPVLVEKFIQFIEAEKKNELK